MLDSLLVFAFGFADQFNQAAAYGGIGEMFEVSFSGLSGCQDDTTFPQDAVGVRGDLGCPESS